MNELLTPWVSSLPGFANYSSQTVTALSVVLILLGAALTYVLVKWVIIYGIHRLFTQTESELDDVLVKHRTFNRLAYVIPAWLVYRLLPGALADYPLISNVLTTLVAIYLVLAVVMVVDSLIDALLEIYQSFPVSRRVPVRSFGQVAKLLIYFIAIICIVSVVLGKSPITLFAGLGAMTAVLMLVFKDPILGFVAGLQLSYNKMVNVGDWVEVPQHNADGDILEIGLTTVKVQNFDNTITTVPTQSLINESFKNWRGMQESPGRRIKRALYVDLNSIRFCDAEALERYAKVEYIKEYMANTLKDVEQYNQQHAGNQDSTVNVRRLTNIGTFRAYILAYLKNHPSINQNLTVMVRQLAPTEAGLPLEIYAFSADKNWVNYEVIQADIFDHLIAVAQEFDLNLFQKPSGVDLRGIGGKVG